MWQPRKPVADALTRRDQIESELDPILAQITLITGLDEDGAVGLLVARSRRDARVAKLLLERAALRETIHRMLEGGADGLRPK